MSNVINETDCTDICKSQHPTIGECAFVQAQMSPGWVHHKKGARGRLSSTVVYVCTSKKCPGILNNNPWSKN